MTGGKLKVLGFFCRMYRTFFAWAASTPLALVNFPFYLNTISRYLYSLMVSICLLFNISGWMSGHDTELLKIITFVIKL